MVETRESNIPNRMNDLRGEPAGARTRDHRIKSAMLYQLSYRLKHNQDSMWTLS